MATLNTTNIKHASSSSNNIVLASDGKVTFPQNTGNILQVVSTTKQDVFSIQGVNSGLASTINITVKTDTTGTGDAQGTQDPTTDANTGGDTTGGAGGQTYSGGKPNV